METSTNPYNKTFVMEHTFIGPERKGRYYSERTVEFVRIFTADYYGRGVHKFADGMRRIDSNINGTWCAGNWTGMWMDGDSDRVACHERRIVDATAKRAVEHIANGNK